jgi:hypothetical protein
VFDYRTFSGIAAVLLAMPGSITAERVAEPVSAAMLNTIVIYVLLAAYPLAPLLRRLLRSD